MTINEVSGKQGEWEVRLRDHTPRSILDQLTYFGHIVVVPGRINPLEYGDNLLATARYVGVFRERDSKDEKILRGAGMSFWLGDEDNKGDILETPVVLTAQTFAASITALLPPGGAVTAGTLFSVAGSYDGTHKWQTPKQAIDYVCGIFSTPSIPVEWRVNGNATLDAGPITDLYRITNPQAIMVRREAGRDLRLSGLPGTMDMSVDVKDYSNRVVVLGEGEGESIVTGAASAVSTPYNDLHGNDVKFTRIVSSAATTLDNTDAVAALNLNRFANPRYNLGLRSSAYEVKGVIEVGDAIYVFDPDNGFVDAAVEQYWEGEVINPIRLRCIELLWPVRQGWTVAFRTHTGTWLDLSPYYAPESGDTTVVVGDPTQTLSGISSEPVGTRPDIPAPGADATTPNAPAFVVPFNTVAYQSDTANDIRSVIYLSWTTPTNTDASSIVDGDHYEIRYRSTHTFSYGINWAVAETFDWDQLGTWGRPLSNPAVVADEWVTAYVGWGTNELTIPELMISAEYEFQIRAVDAANPPNRSAWSASTFQTSGTDTLAPKQPAAAEVAASMTAVQVLHRLGDTTGAGDYTLARDLHHLEVHAGGPNFFAEESTLIGSMIANSGNLMGKIPVLATFQVAQTDNVWIRVIAVDSFGNKSPASEPAQSSVDLVDSAHISSITASQITAGTLMADFILGAAIKTSETGQRVELNSEGIQLFDAEGEVAVNLTADDSTPNFIGIRDGDETVAAMNADGTIAAQVGNFAQDIEIAGRSFISDYDVNRPRGLVAFGSSEFDSAQTVGSGEAALFGFRFNIEDGRMYTIETGNLQVNGNTNLDQYTIRIRGTKNPQVTTTSNLLAGCGVEIWQQNTDRPFGIVKFPFRCDSTIPESIDNFWPGTLNCLLTLQRMGGTGTARLSTGGSLYTPIAVSVNDVGPLIPNAFVLWDTDVPVDSPTDPTSSPNPEPTRRYVDYYFATWGGTYAESGAYVPQYDSEVHQGHYAAAGYGNQRGLIGFDYNKIKADLAGATIIDAKLRLHAFHWYFNAGGTAILGTHDYTDRPGTWADSRVNQNQQTQAGWPKPGTKEIIVANAWLYDFLDDTVRGIAIGPGPSTSSEYYGKFVGTGENRARLCVTYMK